MSIDARARAGNERGHGRDERRGYGSEGHGPRRYGAITSGSNALRIGLFDDVDEDEFVVDDDLRGTAPRRDRWRDDRLDDVDDVASSRVGRESRAPVRARPARGVANRVSPGQGQRSRASLSRGPQGQSAAGRTADRGRAAAPSPRRAPTLRARRGRTPWVSDVTPARLPAAERGPRAHFLLFLVGLVVVGVVGVLVLNTKINENSFLLGDLKETQAALSLQEQQLEQQLAALESPGSLRAAAARLGLVPAGSPAYISLPDGRVVGVPQPAAGEAPAEP